MEFAGFIFALMTGSFAAGYAFRGFIGKEIQKVGAELAQIHAKAGAELQAIVAEVKAKI